MFLLPINLKSESNDDHCHCVNAQQQSFEYIDNIESLKDEWLKNNIGLFLDTLKMAKKKLSSTGYS